MNTTGSVDLEMVFSYQVETRSVNAKDIVRWWQITWECSGAM